MVNLSNIGKKVKKVGGELITKSVLNPITELAEENLADITTTVGSFVIRKVRGKFQRSLSFTVGDSYNDAWMEESLYGILYKYNNIKKSSKLEMKDAEGFTGGDGLYFRLGDGVHNLRYRNYPIMLVIQTQSNASPSGRIHSTIVYTIITYDLSPEFVDQFAKDMIASKSRIFNIKQSTPTINIWEDEHEGDGWTYWAKRYSISRRPINTVYLPRPQKELLVNTVNNFFATKDLYEKCGQSHNLKILLYGDPGLGKDSIVRMIASEWNRTICYITGGKDGKFIPKALTDPIGDRIPNPLFVISDIDKYPYLINEPEVKLEETKEETVKYRNLFGQMINALDGILSGNDKIIIMTTNHIEKFSPAFLRPGRIDLQMELGYVTPEVFRQFTYDFFKVILPKDIELKNNKIRIAEMQCDVLFLKMTGKEFIDKYVK